jgi:flagellar hook-basal body protein
MIQTLFNGLSGVKTHQFGVDTWSNNIANVNTTGYRADIPMFETVFSEALSSVNANSPTSNTLGFGVTASSANFDVTNGSYVNADNINSLALTGEGWFVVGDKAGHQYYTRDGNFTKDSEGYLVNQDGMYVLGYDLGKVENSTFMSDLSEDQEVTATALASHAGELQPLQIIDDTFFQPTATTYVDARINLNKEQNIKPIDQAFKASVYNNEIDQVAQRDLAQFYDIKDGSVLAIKLTDENGNTIIDEDGNAQEGKLTYMSGLETADVENMAFSTISQLQDLINLDGRNQSVEFVLSIEDGNFQFKNISGEQFTMDFSESSIELLTAFALPNNIKMTALGDTVRTAPLYQKNFYEQDMNTLHNDTLAAVDIKTNDDFSVRINGSLVKDKILYTHESSTTDYDNIENGKFNSVKEFITGVENLLREKVTYLKDSSGTLINTKTGDIKDQDPAVVYEKSGSYLVIDNLLVDSSGNVVDATTSIPTGEVWETDSKTGYLINPNTGGLIQFSTGIERDPATSYIKNIDGTLSIPGTNSKVDPYTMEITVAEGEETPDLTFSTQEELGDLRVRVYMQDCRIKFENITDERINIDFSSANLDFIKSLGLSAEINLDPEGATQTSKMYVPTYSTSNEVYDISGKKYFLNTSYVLKSKQELVIGEDIWDMYSMIYSLENDSLVSDNYTLGQLRFEDVNLSPKLYSVDIDGETGNKVYTEKIRSTKDNIFESLEIDFNVNANADTILFNPTGTENGISTAASYMDSVIRNDTVDGNPEGYLNTMVVDLNGIINYYFSNEKAEAFGRVAVVDFVNEQGLQKVSGNLFSSNINAGQRDLLWDDETGNLMGTTVKQNTLETSNVDMNQALTSLIVMQRGYSSSAKTISTADEMLKKAIDMKR